MKIHKVKLERDPEYHKLADKFLEAASNSKSIEFGYVNNQDETFVHKGGKWEKGNKFKFNTPQLDA